MTNQGVNFQLPSGGQFSAAVDTSTPSTAAAHPKLPRGPPHHSLRQPTRGNGVMTAVRGRPPTAAHHGTRRGGKP